jgi:sugar O-acyltransferase (sialic acid O-acetyltransferase NeuD family)
MNLGIYCAGGFGKEIFDVALRANEKNSKWKNIFFIDDFAISNSKIYLGSTYRFDDLKNFFDKENTEIVIANGEPAVRKILFEKCLSNNFKFATLIEPSAVISPSAIIGQGTIIATHCTIASSSIIGNNVALNVKTIIGHDILIKDHSVLSSMVNIGGNCVIGSSCYIGMGAMIKEGLIVGDDVILGMGSVLHNNLVDDVIALGNPARPMRKNTEKKVFK